MSTDPFLKWVGGKRQLLPDLRQVYPPKFDSYFEPFLGGGAVFFDLHSQGLLADRSVVLSDLNGDLIGAYLMVRDRVDERSRERLIQDPIEPKMRALVHRNEPHFV